MLRTVKNPKPDNWRFEDNILHTWFVLLFPVGWKTGSSWTSAGQKEMCPEQDPADTPALSLGGALPSRGSHGCTRDPRAPRRACRKKSGSATRRTEGPSGEPAATLPLDDAKARGLHRPPKSTLDGRSSLLRDSRTSPLLMTRYRWSKDWVNLASAENSITSQTNEQGFYIRKGNSLTRSLQEEELGLRLSSASCNYVGMTACLLHTKRSF